MNARKSQRTRAPRLSEVVGRLLDRRIGRLTGQAGWAAGTAHHMALFAIVVTLSFAAFFTTYDLASFRVLVVMNLAFAAAHVACLLLARLGRQLGASLTYLVTAVTQLVVTTAFVGWQGGFHLYLLLGGQLVFMMFTERQAGFRWLFAAVALSGFLGCQFLLPAGSAVVVMPDVVLTTMFSLNALLTAAMLFVLAAISHFRGERSRHDAAALAARAEYLANTDALTGLATRRPVLERLDAFSTPGGSPYSLAIGDIDHFKAINDTYGHVCGDRVLAQVGARLRAGLRATDAVGRWGGEEFVFVMAQAEAADAVVTMERVRAALSDVAVECGDHEHSITVSIGLTQGSHDGTPHRTLRRADDALYLAKKAGRNRVAIVELAADDVVPPDAPPGAS